MTVTKRFIAGAVCPRCSAMDTITMHTNESNETVRECVSCGFSDSMPLTQSVDEISTRVNQPRAGEKPLAHEDEVKVVKLLDPKNQ